MVESHRKHSGRKRTSRTISNIKKAAEIVSKKQRIAVEEFSDELENSVGSAFTIIHDDLHMRSVCSKWIPYILNDQQKANRMDAAKIWIDVFRDQQQWRKFIVVDEKIFRFDTEDNKRSNRCWISDNLD